MIKEEIWVGRDNLIEWVLFTGDTPISDLSSLTRVVVCIGEEVIDSDVVGSSVIWWYESVTNKEISEDIVYTGDVLRMKLGRVTLTPDTYENCTLTIFSPDYTNGMVISDDIVFKVNSTCSTS